MRFWQSLRYIEREREGEAELLLGLTTRCNGRDSSHGLVDTLNRHIRQRAAAELRR